MPAPTTATESFVISPPRGVVDMPQPRWSARIIQRDYNLSQTNSRDRLRACRSQQCCSRRGVRQSLALARKIEFIEAIHSDSTSPVLFEKIFRFAADPNHFHIPRRPVPQRGVSRSSRTLERDAVDAGGASDEGTSCGRRSRMVLTPRRWRQVCGMAMSALTGLTRRADDGDNKARSPGRVRRKPLKPLRAGMPGDPARPW
jgi:hypothetical protein